MSEPIKLNCSHYQRKLWKNGGGFSDEIAIYPKDAIFPQDSFLWRLSTAYITQSGPFSPFVGYDRYLTCVSDSTLLLQIGTEQDKLSLGEIKKFAGEVEVFGQLIDSKPVQDLNLIFKRDRVKVDFKFIPILNQNPVKFDIKDCEIFIYGITGNIQIRIGPAKHDKALALAKGETFYYNCKTKQNSISIQAENELAKLIFIELKQVGN